MAHADSASPPPRLVNLTAHPVRLVGPSGVVELPSAGLARVRERSRVVGSLGGVDLVETDFGDVEGLPEPQDGVTFVVSRFLALARPDRADLVFPSVELRDDEGRIIGAAALARLGAIPAVPILGGTPC